MVRSRKSISINADFLMLMHWTIGSKNVQNKAITILELPPRYALLPYGNTLETRFSVEHPNSKRLSAYIRKHNGRRISVDLFEETPVEYSVDDFCKCFIHIEILNETTILHALCNFSGLAVGETGKYEIAAGGDWTFAVIANTFLRGSM